MVPMCIMEVASLLASPPPTVTPLHSECVSIMGLPLPLQVGPGEGGVGVWAATGSGPGHACDPSAETHQEVFRLHWNQGTPLSLCILYDWDSCVFNAHIYVDAYLWGLWELQLVCRLGNTVYHLCTDVCNHAALGQTNYRRSGNFRR